MEEDEIRTEPVEVSDRSREVAELIRRANDPEDSYDGHHGNDRTVGA